MSEAAAPTSLIEHFSDCEDPRRELGKEHLLIDIIVIAILAVICRANDFSRSRSSVETKRRGCGRFWNCPQGLLRMTALGASLRAPQPSEFQRCFLNWVRGVAKLTEGEVSAIDGKTPRR